MKRIVAIAAGALVSLAALVPAAHAVIPHVRF